MSDGGKRRLRIRAGSDRGDAAEADAALAAARWLRCWRRVRRCRDLLASAMRADVAVLDREAEVMFAAAVAGSAAWDAYAARTIAPEATLGAAAGTAADAVAAAQRALQEVSLARLQLELETEDAGEVGAGIRRALSGIEEALGEVCQPVS